MGKAALGKRAAAAPIPCSPAVTLSWDICSGERGSVGRAKGLSLGKRSHRINWNKLELKFK